MNKAQLQARFEELSGETAPEELTKKQLQEEIDILENALESDTDPDTDGDENTHTNSEVFVATQTLNISGSFVNEGDELEFSDDNEKLRDDLLEKGYITVQ